MRQESGKSMGFAIGALQHMEAIKAAGNESDFFSRWAGYYAKSLNAEREINTKDVVITSVPYLLQSLSTAALLGIGAWRIIHGDLTIGMLLALQALLAAFLNPLMQMVNLGSTLQTLKIDIARLNDVLKNKIDRVFTFSKEVAQQENGYKLNGYLELKNITFGYSPLSPPLIDQLNLKLKPGQRVALVGPTGCGKSTIAKMVRGLYEPWSGEILYDGKPIQEIPRNVLHHSIASVDQDIFLFSGKIKDNLTLWDSTISESEIIQAAKDAQIHDEILKRKENYEAKLTEGGANLSGGQRQRLEIARALVLSPSILIMDEATSALDSTSEELISRNIRKRGCTCVMIAHRLSTIKDCDEILVLDQGKVVQRGTHDELRSLPGIYQELIEKEGNFE
jgi:ABC-type bacteriocin/lantibiotic exporter with double-glycine peptidase domain